VNTLNGFAFDIALGRLGRILDLLEQQAFSSN